LWKIFHRFLVGTLALTVAQLGLDSLANRNALGMGDLLSSERIKKPRTVAGSGVAWVGQ